MDRGYATVGRALRVSAGNYPGKTAICEVGRDSLTYAEMNAMANRLAHFAAGKGVTKGCNVAIISLNSIEHALFIYALAKLGAVPVSIDPNWTPFEIARAVGYFDCRMVFMDKALKGKIADVDLGKVPFGVHLFDPTVRVADSLGAEIMASGDHEPGVEVLDQDVFTLVLTSGTTGMPKGCVRTHRNVEIGCIKDALGKGLGNKSSELIVAPIYYGTARGSMLTQVYVGGTIHMMAKFDERTVAQYITEHGITDISLAPAMVHRILKLEDLDRYDFSSLLSLRKVGSPFTKNMVSAVLDKITKNVFQGFASTESGGVTILKPQDQLRKPGSSGLPRWGVEMRIFGDDDQPMPCGSIGEIRVSGANVCQGYYKNKEEQDKVFKDGWYHTGDLGWVDEEGYLYVVGRAKNMIKTGSINVAPLEIEGVILEVPAIDDVVVFGVPDEEWGEAVKAAIVLKPGCATTVDDIKQHCRSKLAGYKVPKTIITVETIPRNATGKVYPDFVESHRK